MTISEVWTKFVDYALETGDFPGIENFSSSLGLPVTTMKKIMQRWLSEDKIFRKGNSYAFTDKKIQEKLNNDVRKIKPVNGLKKKQTGMILKIIKTVITVIGIILTCVSIHLTFDFNKLGMAQFWAFMLSISIVCFMSFAFTIKSYMNKSNQAGFVVILWVLGIFYSVFTAVSGQYNDFRKYSASDKSVQNESKRKIYERQLKALEKKQEELLHWREQETEYSLNPYLKVQNPGTWRMIQKGAGELSEVEKDITEVQNRLLENIEDDTVNDETVYNWLASFLNVKADIIQFIIILFPAVFIDLCATVCFTFSLGKDDSI